MASQTSKTKQWSDIVATSAPQPKPVILTNKEPETGPFSMAKYHQQMVANAHSFAKMGKPKHKPCGEVCQFSPPKNRCYGCQASARDRHSCDGHEISMHLLPNIYGQYDCLCNECPKCEESYYWTYEASTKTTEGGPCVCGYGTPERI